MTARRALADPVLGTDLPRGRWPPCGDRLRRAGVMPGAGLAETNHRSPGASRDPFVSIQAVVQWVPACAGTADNSGLFHEEYRGGIAGTAPPLLPKRTGEFTGESWTVCQPGRLA